MQNIIKSNYISRWLKGFNFFFKGLIYIKKNNLWRYILLPSIVSVVCSVILFFSVYSAVSIGVESWLSNTDSFWNSLLSVSIQILSVIVSLVFTLFSYRTLSSIIITPFLAPLLSKLEVLQTGQSIDISFYKDIKNALIGVIQNIKFLCIEILLMILSIFTGPVQPFIISLFEGYILGYGSFIYLLEKHTNSSKELTNKMKLFFPELHGLGTAYFVILLIPIVGAFIAPASALTGAVLVFYADKK